MTQRAIEVSFPIVEINRLAVPERNAFKPIYQMHKWFARRASSVFRAILLASMKPAGTDIMDEFYKDHTNDPDTCGKTILDPFMGGGTTVVEALRLGGNVTGIDLNPVAWFIVKTEIEPVNIDELKDAFERLANREVSWSGKSTRDTLRNLYKTECTCCGGEADIIYTFWARSAICHNPVCPGRSGDQGVQIPLLSNYIVSQKAPSIRYWRDATCPKCKKTFDWEVDPAILVPEAKLQVNASRSGGLGRSSSRWTYSVEDEVKCPWCSSKVKPIPPKPQKAGEEPRKERKKIPLTALLCPSCEAVWQYRGDLPEKVSCPVCAYTYDPHKGTLVSSYDFVCPSCGTRDGVLASLRRIPPEQRLILRPYAIEAHCQTCSSKHKEEVKDSLQASLLFEDEVEETQSRNKHSESNHECLLLKSNGKFFKRISPQDTTLYQNALHMWEKEKSSLPYPKQEIPFGYETNVGHDLPGHGFSFWHHLFNGRQLLGLSTLLDSIQQENNLILREMLLSAFFQLLRNQCLLCFYNPGRDELEPAFSRKDFAPPKTPCENSVWGSDFGRGTFSSIIDKIILGKSYNWKPYDRRSVMDPNKKTYYLEDFPSNEVILGSEDNTRLYAQSSTHLDMKLSSKVDLIITDPPYADNVNYSEVADFFYVWLRLVLADSYSCFIPEFTPKADEIIAQETRGRSMEDFQQGLTEVFAKSQKVLSDEGLLVFTFHHEANSAWEAVLNSVMEAGFYIQAAYPIESDATKSGSMGAQKIAYDIIHVCKKRDPNETIQTRSWARVRQDIRRRAREEIRAIEEGRYGREPLAVADINIILVGKCLELYSRHYGAVVDAEGDQVSLHDALIEIRSMVDELVEKEQPLPSELDEIDAESRVYLLTLASQKTIKSDDLHKATRGILEPDDLMRTGLIIKGRSKGSRTFEVKQPTERLSSLVIMFQPDTKEQAAQLRLFDDMPTIATPSKALFIDKVHILLAMAQSGENIMPWLERFSGDRPQLRAAFEYLAEKNKNFTSACEKILHLMDPGPLFREG